MAQHTHTAATPLATIRRAFTLVEILIVVVILGILSAIIVPLYAGATQDSWEGSLQANLNSLQSQIELYNSRMNDYPDFAGQQWSQLLAGEYIKAPPVNPAYSGGQPRDSVTEVTGTTYGALGSAWVWNSDLSTICASNFREARFYDTDENIVTTNAVE